MGEKLNRVIMPLAATAAAATLGIGEARAVSQEPATDSEPEIAQQADRRQSMEAVNHWANEHLRAGEDLNFWRGSVTISHKNGDKMSIVNPIVAFRYGTTSPKEHDFALRHPRSGNWAIGYVIPAKSDGVKSQPARVVLLPFNNGGNNFQFYPDNPRVTPVGDHPSVDVVRFRLDENGEPDLSQPTDHFGKPLLDDATEQPMTIGRAQSPFPKMEGHPVHVN